MDYNNLKKTECDSNCFNYGMFGGIGGCDALDNSGGAHQPIEPEQTCLHPDKKELSIDLGVFSLQGLCAALEGEIIVGGENDNTKLVKVLTES